MNSGERKKQFVILLQKLLQQHEGVQLRLAKKLEINSTRMSSWLQKQVDPINLDTVVFNRIAEVAGYSSEELAKKLAFAKIHHTASPKFYSLIKEMLSTQTQEQLGEILGVKQSAISRWLNPEKNIDPQKISAGTMFAIAQQKGWTFDELLIYLDLKQNKIYKKSLTNYQSEMPFLTLSEQIELLAWLSDLVKTQVKKSNNLFEMQIKNNLRSKIEGCTVCVILETEDLAIATNYATNLVLHLNLKPENIKVTTIPNLPESIADIDILIFDISTPESASIALIENIEFDRDIIVFVDAGLPTEARSSLEDKVTDLLVKPIDWQVLKDKAYFS